jgi:hypothetical protein
MTFKRSIPVNVGKRSLPSFSQIFLLFGALWGFILNGCNSAHRPLIMYYSLSDSVAAVNGLAPSFLLHPRAPFFVEDFAAVIDVGNGRIVVFDSTLNRARFAFGQKGQGPGEFIEPFILRAHRGHLFVFDRGNLKISIFDTTGRYIDGFRLGFEPSDMAVLSDGKILLLHPSENHILHIYDQKGERIHSFGELIPEKDARLSMLYSMGYISVDEYDNVYIVFSQYPRMRKYNRNGNLLWEEDLSKYEELEEMYSRILKKRKDPSRRYALFFICLGSTFHDNKLYVGYTGVIPYGNTIYVFDTRGKLRKIIRISRGDIPIERLPDGWHFSMGPSEELWIAVRRESRILKYTF